MKRRKPAEERPALVMPDSLDELMQVIGSDAAWRLIAAKGGQMVFIPAKIANQAHPLARIIGLPAARALADHFRVGSTGHSFLVPLGRAYQQKLAMVRALEGGATANQAAAASGMHIRTAYRTRKRLKDDEPSLFDQLL